MLLVHLGQHDHWDCLQAKYDNCEEKTLYEMGKMMARCVKLYSLVDQIMHIFKLNSKMQVSTFDNQIIVFYPNNIFFQGALKSLE